MADEKQKNADMVEEKPLNEDVPKKQYGNKSFVEKLAYIKNNVTVEPLLAGFVVPSIISRFAMGNLNLDKACRVNLKFGDEICDELVRKGSNNYTEYEREIQKLISSTDIWKSILGTAMPCLIIMFLGAWSDRTGKRKIIILLPICGEIITSIGNLINVYFFYEVPLEITVLSETLFYSLTGGWVTLFLGVFSYISDITSEKTRTFRVGLVNFCFTVGLPLGMALGGILIRIMGYYVIFSLILLLFTLVLFYGMFVLVEPDIWLKKRCMPPIERPDPGNKSFFNLSHVAETISVAFKKRVANKRMKVLLTLFCVFILHGPSMAEHNVFYLFVRNELNWDIVKYSLYTSYAIILHSFGAMFSITILSKRFQMDDSLLCIISIMSKFASSMWTAFVTTDIELYIVPIVDVLNASTTTSLRSITSKLVERQETAKVNSIFSLTETLAALVFLPFYSWFYMKTLHVLPGAAFLISAAATIPASIILATFYIKNKKSQGKSRKKAPKAEERKEAEANKSALDITNKDKSELKTSDEK